MTATRHIELSDLEVRHIAETCRELLRTIEGLRAYMPDVYMGQHEEDIRETLRILREEDHDEA